MREARIPKKRLPIQKIGVPFPNMGRKPTGRPPGRPRKNHLPEQAVELPPQVIAAPVAQEVADEDIDGKISRLLQKAYAAADSGLNDLMSGDDPAKRAALGLQTLWKAKAMPTDAAKKEVLLKTDPAFVAAIKEMRQELPLMLTSALAPLIELSEEAEELR